MQEIRITDATILEGLEFLLTRNELRSTDLSWTINWAKPSQAQPNPLEINPVNRMSNCRIWT